MSVGLELFGRVCDQRFQFLCATSVLDLMLLACVLVPSPSVVLRKRKFCEARYLSDPAGPQTYPTGRSFTRTPISSDESSSDGGSSSGDASTSEFSGADDSGDEEVSNDFSKSQSRASTSSIVKKPRPRRHACSFAGCTKAYTRPSRLAEHERSHSGLVQAHPSSHQTRAILTVSCTKQRPFTCTECKKSYLRETHLHAHLRSHLPESSRPFVCEANGRCGKRFWTKQHLGAHVQKVHDGVKPYQVSCTRRTLSSH